MWSKIITWQWIKLLCGHTNEKQHPPKNSVNRPEMYHYTYFNLCQVDHCLGVWAIQFGNWSQTIHITWYFDWLFLGKVHYLFVWLFLRFGQLWYHFVVLSVIFIEVIWMLNKPDVDDCHSVCWWSHFLSHLVSGINRTVIIKKAVSLYCRDTPLFTVVVWFSAQLPPLWRMWTSPGQWLLRLTTCFFSICVSLSNLYMIWGIAWWGNNVFVCCNTMCVSFCQVEFVL